jgi:hypothetical protein
VFRNRLLELFEAFDFPDPNLVMGKRNVSTVATQAHLMNSPFMMEQARHAAKATLGSPGLDARVERAYRVTLGRLPTPRRKKSRWRLYPVNELGTARGVGAAVSALFASIDFRYVN